MMHDAGGWLWLCQVSTPGPIKHDQEWGHVVWNLIKPPQQGSGGEQIPQGKDAGTLRAEIWD